jgi:phosphodiesterase/alkaline phosphatase D-like protein
VRGAQGAVRYRSWRWGQHLECFLLDTRRFRSANDAVDSAAKTMLGGPQEAWLADALARSTATFKLVCTSVPLDFGIGNDHWATFQTARQRLFDAAATPRGVVFVSADQHWFASHRHTPAGTNEAYAYSYLFAYTIDVPPNAKTLTLPNNDNVRILAITGSNERTSVKPARALYDTLGNP